MSKKCINPECEFFDKPVFDDSDEHCSWCNSELVIVTGSSVAPTASPQPAALPRTATTSGVATASGMGTHVQSDTRYNSDDIQFGGSQFNAQSVDNRTQNSSVTNVTHIGTEDGEQLIKCPVTFRRFKKKDAYCCPICNKDVSPEGFNKELGMCGNCAKKKQEEEKARAEAQAEQMRKDQELRMLKEALRRRDQETAQRQHLEEEKVFPAAMSSSRPAEPVVAAPIGGAYRESPNRGGFAKNRLVVCLLSLLVVGAGFGGVLLLNHNTISSRQMSEQVEMPQEQEFQATTSVDTQRKSQGKTSPSTTELATDNVQQEPPSAAVELTPLEQGLMAFKAGEYSKAKVFLEQSLGEGGGKAAYALATMYRDGNGVAQSSSKAFSLMKQAADAGCSDAFYDLGEMYRQGDGTEPNRAQAKKWFERAVTSSGRGASKAAEALEDYE